MSKLVVPDAAEGDEFGRSVAVSESTIVVGAFNDDDSGFANAFHDLFSIISNIQTD